MRSDEFAYALRSPPDNTMDNHLKILFAAAEAGPLVKAGGLGDVVGSLPKALRRRGYDARIVLPKYGVIDLQGYQTHRISRFSVDLVGSPEEVDIIEILLADGTPVYLVENQVCYGRPVVYGEHDDLKRFLLLSLVAAELPDEIGWHPDVLHCQDWHTGLVPALLKSARNSQASASSCASVFTIHNLEYQGWFDDYFAGAAGLHQFLPAPEDPLRAGTYSMTGLGIYHGDVISTVSETYAGEILTAEYGEGLDGLLASRRDSVYGILNGVDYEQFNPATDRQIAVNYSVDSLHRRVENKIALQKRANLALDADTPLIGMAGRLVRQKGIDIAAEAVERLVDEEGVQFVLQGTGDPGYHELLQGLERRHPDHVRMFLTLDFTLAQFIYAGSDLFLTPSRFEPCGLSPLIAMHYGAIPVVRRTGGLAQTVSDQSADRSARGTGFVFEKYDAGELHATLKRALSALRSKDTWHELVIRAMTADFSWNPSIPKYEALYRSALERSASQR